MEDITMAIIAPLSKYKRNNILIFIAIMLAAAAYCAYDGYYNKDFIEKHTDTEGNPKSTLTFNRKSPPVFIAVALLLGGYVVVIKNNRIIADEDQLVINDKEKITYDSIQKIDKTHFDSKGFFTVTYKPETSQEIDRKISDRKYDNLAAVLDQIVAKIS